jgi:hypothetical protein
MCIDLKIGLRGGELTSADILQYPKVKDQPGVPVRCCAAMAPMLYVLQSGAAGRQRRAPAQRPRTRRSTRATSSSFRHARWQSTN